jgi:hypothetical protein
MAGIRGVAVYLYLGRLAAIGKAERCHDLIGWLRYNLQLRNSRIYTLWGYDMGKYVGLETTCYKSATLVHQPQVAVRRTALVDSTRVYNNAGTPHDVQAAR